MHVMSLELMSIMGRNRTDGHHDGHISLVETTRALMV